MSVVYTAHLLKMSDDMSVADQAAEYMKEQ